MDRKKTLLIQRVSLSILIFITSLILITCDNEITDSIFELPTLTTNIPSDITANSATVGGNVTDDGGDAITDRGIFYGISSDPVTTGAKMQIGDGTGNFSTNLSNLTSNTTYYVKAYATNSVGTTYGDEISFTTALPTITTAAIIDITFNAATSGGEITEDGGGAIMARGVCWNTTGDPTITDNKTSDGSGTGVFISSITGLTKNTTYYVCAYATNSLGTQYGTSEQFTTASIQDIDGNYYQTVQIGTQEWMAYNLKTTKYNDGTEITLVTDNTAWSNLSTEAYCWYSNDEATYKPDYGALYNWYAVNTGILCPTDWHVPSDAEWTVLTDYLGASGGGKLKEIGTTHWQSPNTGATNESGFTALPGGYRYSGTGTFLGIGASGGWWSSTESSASSYQAWYRKLYYSSDGVDRDSNLKRPGFSIRCIKD